MGHPTLTFEQREHYLFVTSEGVRTDFASVVEVTEKLNEMVGKTPTPYMLLDYRKVQFNLPQTNAFDLIRIYETRMTNFKNLTLAIVFASSDIKGFTELWQELSQKRGFRFMTFTDINKAEEWLIEQKRIRK